MLRLPCVVRVESDHSVTTRSASLQVFTVFNHLGVCKSAESSRMAVDTISPEFDGSILAWKNELGAEAIVQSDFQRQQAENPSSLSADLQPTPTVTGANINF